MTDEQRAARLPDPEYLPYRSVVERVAHGVAAREHAPRRSHADWRSRARPARPGRGARAPGRPAGARPGADPLRPHGRSRAFAFFRGGAAIMAADLSGTPSSGTARPALRRRPPAQLRHLRHAGALARLRPERLRRDPARPDRVGRQAPRRQRRDRRPRPRLRRRPARSAAVVATVRAYREAMLDFAVQRNLDVWYARLSAAELQDRLTGSADHRRPTRRSRSRINKALKRDHLHAFSRLVEDGRRPARSSPTARRCWCPSRSCSTSSQRERYVEVIQDVPAPVPREPPARPPHAGREYRFVHMARKVVGVGSVGTRAWVVLLVGRDAERPAAPPAEGGPAVGARPLRRRDRLRVPGPPGRRGPAPHAGRQRPAARLVPPRRLRRRGPRLLRAPALGRQGLDRRRPAQPGRPRRLRRELRLDPRPGPRPLRRPCRHRRLPRRRRRPSSKAIAEFAAAYADTNEADHRRLCEAVEAGELVAETGI